MWPAPCTSRRWASPCSSCTPVTWTTPGPVRPSPLPYIALTLLIFGSILVGRPFTESYARQTTPEPVWRTSRFHSLNRQISAIWGLAFTVGTVSLIAAGSVGSRQVLLRIIVPFGPLLRLRLQPEAGHESPTGDSPADRAGKLRLPQRRLSVQRRVGPSSSAPLRVVLAVIA